MRLSREKINHLSTLIVDELAGNAEITFKHPRNDIRLQIVEVLRVEMEREERIEEAARQRIISMRKDIPEGGEEWNVLYDKFYREESEKQRKVK